MSLYGTVTEMDLKAEVRKYHAEVADEIPPNVYMMFVEILNIGQFSGQYRQGVIDSLLNLAGMVSDGDLGLRGDNE